jgi:hypothetical protein
MSSPFITISRGGPATDLEDGVYTVTLTEISDPKTVMAQRGPNAGNEISLIDWTFAVDEGELEGSEITATTSTASGPKSKMYAYLTALFGGKAPPVGTQLTKDHIVGRRALATIAHNDGGWPIVANLGAIPNTMPQAQAAPRPPAQPTDTTAMVKANERAARRAHPASENLVFSAQQGVVPGTGIVPAAPVAVAADDDLPF